MIKSLWSPLMLLAASLFTASAYAKPSSSTIALSFVSDQVEYQQGESALLSWATANAKFCQASGDWSGKLPSQGTYRTGPLDASKSYTLKCLPDSKNFRSNEDTINISVSTKSSIPSSLPPTLSFTTSDSSVSSGSSTTLSWSATDAESCFAEGDWSGSKATSGNQTVGPLEISSSFSLSCTGPGGSINDAVAVSVLADTPAPTLSFTTSDSSVSSGSSTTLSWSATDAQSCTASGGWNGSKQPTGSEFIGSISTGTTYSLSCTGPGGSVVEMLSVSVRSAITIEWQKPTENTDGTILTDLASYRIYLGSMSGNYDNVLEVNNPSATSHTLDLKSGDHYVTMTALDLQGNESSHSEEALLTAP